MKELYTKLDAYFKFDNTDSTLKAVIKTVIAMVAGWYFSLIARQASESTPVYSWFNISIFVIALGTYIYLEYRRLCKEKNFPISILEHLNAADDLKELNARYNRKTKIHDYIDRSIQSLNANTCPVVSAPPDNKLCHTDLTEGLRRVLEDFIEKPQYILEVDKSKFTVGMYLDNIYNPDDNLPSSERMFVFRDDLFLRDIFRSLSSLSDESREEYCVQISLMEILNFSNYSCKKIVFNDNTHTLIGSPVPNVCENCPAEGVIFAIYQGDDCCPSDVDSILLIFGRIVSNWISKYNECVLHERRNRANGHHVPDLPELQQFNATKAAIVSSNNEDKN